MEYDHILHRKIRLLWRYMMVVSNGIIFSLFFFFFSQFLTRAGVQTVLCNGQMGEFASLTLEERKSLTAFTRESFSGVYSQQHITALYCFCWLNILPLMNKRTLKKVSCATFVTVYDWSYTISPFTLRPRVRGVGQCVNNVKMMIKDANTVSTLQEL